MIPCFDLNLFKAPWINLRVCIYLLKLPPENQYVNKEAISSEFINERNLWVLSGTTPSPRKYVYVVRKKNCCHKLWFLKSKYINMKDVRRIFLIYGWSNIAITFNFSINRWPNIFIWKSMKTMLKYVQYKIVNPLIEQKYFTYSRPLKRDYFTSIFYNLVKK